MSDCSYPPDERLPLSPTEFRLARFVEMIMRSKSADVRNKLLDAVADLMQTRGLAGVTTREIARLAGVAEGTMYNHFKDKSALLIAFLQRAAPATMRAAMIDLPLQVGQRTLRKNLQAVTAAVLQFHRHVAPVICSLLADASLMKAARRGLMERGTGPNLSAERLAAYLAAEQRLGRVKSDCDVGTAVQLLLGASFKIAVQDHLFGVSSSPSKDTRLAGKLVDAFVAGLEPPQSGEA
jgi:AcrR family transcriptional regulator